MSKSKHRIILILYVIFYTISSIAGADETKDDAVLTYKFDLGDQSQYQKTYKDKNDMGEEFFGKQGTYSHRLRDGSMLSVQYKASDKGNTVGFSLIGCPGGCDEADDGDLPRRRRMIIMYITIKKNGPFKLKPYIKEYIGNK